MGLNVQKFEQQIPFTASATNIQKIIETEDGVLLCYGTAANTVLEDTDDTYAPGCIYIKLLAAGTSIMYFNEGTKAEPDFGYASFT